MITKSEMDKNRLRKKVFSSFFVNRSLRKMMNISQNSLLFDIEIFVSLWKCCRKYGRNTDGWCKFDANDDSAITSLQQQSDWQLCLIFSFFYFF